MEEHNKNLRSTMDKAKRFRFYLRKMQDKNKTGKIL